MWLGKTVALGSFGPLPSCWKYLAAYSRRWGSYSYGRWLQLASG